MRKRYGFTLFELLAVVTIIGIVLSVSLGAFHGWGDAQAVRGSAEIVEAALVHARDYAVAQRVPVRFEYQTGVDATNGLKKTTRFQLVSEPSTAVATNFQAFATSFGETIPDEMQYIGPLQKLPGNAWILSNIPGNALTSWSYWDGFERFVFLPNGKVFTPINIPLVLFVVSRKMRSDNNPNIIYRIDIDRSNGTVSTTKCNPDDQSTFARP